LTHSPGSARFRQRHQSAIRCPRDRSALRPIAPGEEVGDQIRATAVALKLFKELQVVEPPLEEAVAACGALVDEGLTLFVVNAFHQLGPHTRRKRHIWLIEQTLSERRVATALL
jgi:hypothetical protein